MLWLAVGTDIGNQYLTYHTLKLFIKPLGTGTWYLRSKPDCQKECGSAILRNWNDEPVVAGDPYEPVVDSPNVEVNNASLKQMTDFFFR